MNKHYWKCALLGGLIVFIWGVVSWMLLPWHRTTSHKFANEKQVAMTIKENARENGIYFLPSCEAEGEKDKQEAWAKVKERMKQGPLVFASVHLEGMDPDSVRPFIGSLIIQIIGAFFATWLFMKTKAMSYGRQVCWFSVLGLFAGIVSTLPAWNWMCFPASWVIVTILDLVIGWTLAGFAIAKVAKK
jgi:hypothetical protein